MSYLEILAYISVGIITFSWILVLVFDNRKKIIDKKADEPIIEENPENENK
ncbi:MAG: hypothetical protein KAJ76_05705 [Candidatus Heimdallarchaeota archaeon]|nr:hypothetical protein [Candidatus Heimdallarchaeota archaeon]MCK5184520.1 hypothetical protein [Candidatus Heimdallarchaeota archaeon]MCK5298380.1 hypothetical protein [Candidatus Heimdallarchaeota archaeon]